MVEFYISQRICTLDESTLPQKGIVGDNSDYIAHFNFDEEWAGKEKTARFVHGDIRIDILLKNDTCGFPPEILKSGLIKVGVYSDIKSSEARVPINASILDEGGNPADPTPNVYEQLLAAIAEIRDSSVSDEEIEAAVQKYLEQNPIEQQTVTVRQWSEEDFKEGEDA